MPLPMSSRISPQPAVCAPPSIYGNSVLVQRNAATGEPRGVTVELARELGRRLGVPVDLVPFDAAGKVFEALKRGAWDIVFLAIEPVRAAEIDFTAPYVIIEGVYMVPKDSALKTVADVDRAGVRIAVNKGSAYDLFLTRTLKHATLVRGDDGIALFKSDKLEAAGGVQAAAGRLRQDRPDGAGAWMAASWRSSRPWARPRAAPPPCPICAPSSRR